MKNNLLLFLFLFLSLLSYNSYAQVANPLHYGLLEATSCEEKFFVLQRCHQDAYEKGIAISYKGIDTLIIDIPLGANPLPLTDDVDFAGATIIVENQKQDCALFIKYNEVEKIQVSGQEIDSGDFSQNKILKNGRYLLIVEDSEPWCGRIGYTSKAYRKEMIVVNNGKASNPPIASYCTPSSRPDTRYREVGKVKVSIRNLNFVRSEKSAYKTNCFDIWNQIALELRNISITTPNDLVKHADKAIHMENCYDVSLQDIVINGTYSQTNKSGYGLYLINIYKLKMNRLYGRGKWGVFGTHCINKVELKDCDINRFDIHCYGKDVKAKGCKFTNLYNQFSSIYGTVEFKNCEFNDFIPILIESSYNAYTPFKLVWKNCTFYLDKKHNYLITLFGVPEAYNDRPELRRKNLPNINLKNSRVVLDDEITTWYLVQTGGVKYKDSFDGISEIAIKGLSVVNEGTKEFKLFSEEVKTTSPVKTVIRMKHRKKNKKNVNEEGIIYFTY